jgi:hypothetical protein
VSTITGGQSWKDVLAGPARLRRRAEKLRWAALLRRYDRRAAMFCKITAERKDAEAKAKQP